MYAPSQPASQPQAMHAICHHITPAPGTRTSISQPCFCVTRSIVARFRRGQPATHSLSFLFCFWKTKVNKRKQCNRFFVTHTHTTCRWNVSPSSNPNNVLSAQPIQRANTQTRDHRAYSSTLIKSEDYLLRSLSGALVKAFRLLAVGTKEAYLGQEGMALSRRVCMRIP